MSEAETAFHAGYEWAIVRLATCLPDDRRDQPSLLVFASVEFVHGDRPKPDSTPLDKNDVPSYIRSERSSGSKIYFRRVAMRASDALAWYRKAATGNLARIKGHDRLKTMTLDATEFIGRFLLHVLPSGFHRIRHYGLFAGTVRALNIERVRQLLAASEVAPERSPAEVDSETETPSTARKCPCCGGRMIIVERFAGARRARSPSPTPIRIDTS